MLRAAAILDGRGQIVKKLTIGVGSGWYNALATNGSELVAVWTRADFARVELLAARFSLEGELLDPEPRVVATETVPRFSSLAQVNLSATWTGSEYLVIWERYRFSQVQMQPLSATLDPIGAATPPLARGTEPRAATGPGATLITHREEAEIRSLLVTHAGAVIAQAAIAPGTSSAVATWGSEFLAIAGSAVVRVGPSGEVTPLTTLPSPAQAAVSTNGSRVHIAYAKDGEVFIRQGSVARARSVRHD